MSRVPRWAWLAVAAGVLVVVGAGVYIGLYVTASHDVDVARRLAALDHETKPAQIRQYRAQLASQAAVCGQSETYLAAAVVVAQKNRPEATAWGLLTSVAPGALSCSTQLLYVGMGTGVAPSSLPDAGA